MENKWTEQEMKAKCDLMMAHIARIFDLTWEMQQHFSKKLGEKIQNDADVLAQLITNIKNAKYTKIPIRSDDPSKADLFVLRNIEFAKGEKLTISDLNKAFLDDIGQYEFFNLGSSAATKAIRRHFPNVGPSMTLHYKGKKVRGYKNLAIKLSTVQVPKETKKIDMPWYDA